MILTVDAGSLELREGFSKAVKTAVPATSSLIEKTFLKLLGYSNEHPSTQRK